MMDTQEAAEYLREIARVRPRSGDENIISKSFRSTDCDKLDEIAELLENCYGCGRCYNTLKKRQTANICKQAHHNGCGCDLDWTRVDDVIDETNRVVSDRYLTSPQPGYDEHMGHVIRREVVPDCLFCKRFAEANTNQYPTVQPLDDHPWTRGHAFQEYQWDASICGYVDGDDQMCGSSREEHV